jgi:hypothetical protein
MAKNVKINKSEGAKAQQKRANQPSNIVVELKNFPFWVVYSIFLITTLIFFWDQLFGNSFFWEDFIEQVFPIQTFAAQSFAQGEIPFWNPYTFCGMPFFADLQVGFFYPLNRLTALFLDSSGNLSVWGLQFIIILHFFIAQVSMYYLMRYFKVSSLGGVISAISFAFSFVMVMHVIHPMMVYHLAWFPLILMYYLKSLETLKIKFAIISGLIFGLSMLAGHPQTILYEALFIGLALIWFGIAKIRQGELKSLRLVKFLLAGLLPMLISVAIFSVQYLPSQDLAELSKRAEASYESAVEGSLEFKQVYTGLVPKIFGFVDAKGDKSVPYHLENAPYYYYWDTAFYFGITAIILAFFAVVNGYRNRLTAFLIFISVFGFLFALGDNFVLFKIFYNLPFFGLLRIPARIMFFVVIAFSVLAGLGFDAIAKSPKNKTIFIQLLIAVAFPLLFSLLIGGGVLQGLISTPEQFISPIQSFGTLALVFVAIVSLVLILMQKNVLKPIVAGVIIIIITFIDLYNQGVDFNNGVQDPKTAYSLDNQFKQMFVPKDINKLYRVSTRHYNPSYMATMRNQGLMDKIMLVEGYNQLVFNHIPPPCDVKNIHDLYNVKYELAFNNEVRQFNFVERQGYLPRAWFVYDSKSTTPENVKSYIEANKNIDFSKTVVLEKNITTKNSPDTIPTENTVKFTKFSNNEISCEVSSEKDGILVFSEIWYPDWKAYLDGEEVEILKANFSFRALVVPKGKHKLEMKYESDKYSTGLLISLITIGLAIIGLVILRKE